jgi:membrane protein implicated in regulation of membrane protease activity
MYLLIIGWMYVVLMMAVSEATSSQGSLLGAFFTFLLYGLLPLSIVLYLVGTPSRRAKRRAQEQAAQPPGEPSGQTPDGGSQAAGDSVAPERKEP